MIMALLQIIIAAACAIVLAELAARLWIRHFSRTYPWKPYAHFEMEPDPKVLPQLSPHTTFRANNLGLRGREVSGAKKVFRIVTCGDGAVECFSLDEAEAWPALVERNLSQPVIKARLGVDEVHVLNFAKSGFTNEALGYLLPRVLDRAGPIDVLTITTSTSAVNSWTKAGTPLLPPPSGNAWDDVHWHAEAMWGWGLPPPAIAEVVRRLQHFIKRPVLTLHNTGGSLAAGRRARNAATEIRDSYPDPAAWIETYETSLGELIQTARRYARRVILLRQSWFDAPDPTPAEFANFWHGFAGDAPPALKSVVDLSLSFFGNSALSLSPLLASKNLGPLVRLSLSEFPGVEILIHPDPEGLVNETGRAAENLLAAKR